MTPEKPKMSGSADPETDEQDSRKRQTEVQVNKTGVGKRDFETTASSRSPVNFMVQGAKGQPQRSEGGKMGEKGRKRMGDRLAGKCCSY